MAVKNSKPMKMIILTEKRLQVLASSLNKKMENWELFEILTAFLYLEKVAKSAPTHASFKNNFYLIRDALRMNDVFIMEKWTKEINCFVNFYVNDRIDKSEKPLKKKGANAPPNAVWLKMVKSLVGTS